MRIKTAPVLAAIAALTIGQGFFNRANFDAWTKYYAPNRGDTSGLTGDQLLFALAGFREMIAGILWVRADTYFEEGNYDAILPIVRLVTILDPRQIDVYSTGMWHIAYNFTDEQSRSDRRYIPSALALGSEGAKANDYTYELFFETGWIWYHKIDDVYDKAVYWWEQAATKPDIQTARRNILANAYLRNGEIEKALGLYRDLLEKAEATMANTDDFQARTNRDTIEQNFDVLLIRMAQRGYFAQKSGYFNQGQYDTQPPFDVKFTAQVTVPEPRVLQVEGTWGVQPVGTRVRIVLRDADYPGSDKFPAAMDFEGEGRIDLDPPKERTFMQDGLFVRNQAFSRRIDMSRDLAMYPFTKDKYVVEFYYNPRSAPSHIQDRFGFSGEGMTDRNYLRTDVRPDQRVVYAKLELTRDQLLRLGEWSMTGKVPTVSTRGFRPVAERALEDVIVVPGLRNQGVNPGPVQAEPAPAGPPPGAGRRMMSPQPFAPPGQGQ